MTVFGKAAVLAVRTCQADLKKTPTVAWAQAIAKYSSSADTRKKVCPREAFFGLCAAGHIAGVLPGEYGQGEKNKEYAISAVKLLRHQPALAENKNELWRQVAGSTKVANGQMDVVLALWDERLIKS